MEGVCSCGLGCRVRGMRQASQTGPVTFSLMVTRGRAAGVVVGGIVVAGVIVWWCQGASYGAREFHVVAAGGRRWHREEVPSAMA